MHTEHGYAAIDDIAPPIGHNISNCASASLVNLAQFTRLPGHIIFVKDMPYFRQKFRIRIVAAGFASGAGILAKANTVAELSGITFFISTGKYRIEGGAHVGR